MNQIPTAIITYPLQRRTAWPVMRTGRIASLLTSDTATEAATRRATKTTAAVAKPSVACAEPMTKAWAARPASRGPVHPKPASR